MKILVFGLPGAGKSTLAEPLAKLVGGVHLNADRIREENNDWDFSPEGRMRQAMRMKFLSDGVVKAGKVAVADFIAPTFEARQFFNADFSIWMDTIQEGRFEDTNKMFEEPRIDEYDYHVSKWFNDTHEQLAKVLEKYLDLEYCR
jgi:adenylylsulfate kinase